MALVTAPVVLQLRQCYRSVTDSAEQCSYPIVSVLRDQLRAVLQKYVNLLLITCRLRGNLCRNF